MKKFFVVVLVISLLACGTFLSNPVYATDVYDFSNFSEADSLAFVEQCNIDIPDGFAEIDQFPAFTRELILRAYHYPDVEFCFNFYDTQRYAEDIRAAVEAHMNLATVPAVASVSYGNSGTLLYNTAMDTTYNWVATINLENKLFTGRWAYYNCYAFAINRPDIPAFYSSTNTYMPGDMSGAGSFAVGSGTVGDLADIICADLWTMGYHDIEVSNTIPTINSTQELICVRRNTWDYHFMRYDLSTNAWYHKPGQTAVLRYNGIPANNVPWTGECFIESLSGDSVYVGPVYHSGGLTDDPMVYDSDIVFITYSKNQINVTDVAYSGAYIQRGKDVFFELNFATPGTYSISVDSFCGVEYDIYENQYVNNVFFSTIESEYDPTEASTITVTAGKKYYLRVNFVTSLYENSVNITVQRE